MAVEAKESMCQCLLQLEIDGLKGIVKWDWNYLFKKILDLLDHGGPLNVNCHPRTLFRRKATLMTDFVRNGKLFEIQWGGLSTRMQLQHASLHPLSITFMDEPPNLGPIHCAHTHSQRGREAMGL